MLQFSQIQEKLFSTALAEAEKRKSSTGGGGSSGIDTFLPNVKAKLSAISVSYQVFIGFLYTSQLEILIKLHFMSLQNFVQTFLFMLSSHSDSNLQGLSVRLDFNECYQRKDHRLSMSQTYSYRRLTTSNFQSLYEK